MLAVHDDFASPISCRQAIAKLVSLFLILKPRRQLFNASTIEFSHMILRLLLRLHGFRRLLKNAEFLRPRVPSSLLHIAIAMMPERIHNTGFSQSPDEIMPA